jgi:hypothetical protein
VKVLIPSFITKQQMKDILNNGLSRNCLETAKFHFKQIQFKLLNQKVEVIKVEIEMNSNFQNQLKRFVVTLDHIKNPAHQEHVLRFSTKQAEPKYRCATVAQLPRTLDTQDLTSSMLLDNLSPKATNGLVQIFAHSIVGNSKSVMIECHYRHLKDMLQATKIKDPICFCWAAETKKFQIVANPENNQIAPREDVTLEMEIDPKDDGKFMLIRRINVSSKPTCFLKFNKKSIVTKVLVNSSFS